jgi:outer membrane protein TolC
MWLAVATGCTSQQPFYLFEDGDLSHYKGMATDLEVPDVCVKPLDEVTGSLPPLTLSNPEAAETWDLSLEETIKDALANSSVLRSLGVALAAPDSITRAPDVAQTVYDPARVESNPRFGTEAALSAFDAQFGTSVFWEKVDQPVNVGGIGDLFLATVNKEDLGTFQAQLSKFNATGGQTSLTHNVRYTQSNSPTRLYPSDWNADITAEFRQPLFQGAGVQFNRIAGPGAIPGYNNGVVLARINTDIALADFESGVRNLVSDVEQAYWNLYLAYRELDSVKVGRDSALQTWRKIYALYVLGARGGEAEKEAQSRAQYFQFRAQVELRLSNVYAAESQLRYMMGLAATDGRLMRPAEEPVTAKVAFDWAETQGEAMARNVDLRRQRWRVKQRELELISAKNYLLPRLDAVGQYRWLGLGDDLWSTERKAPFSTAYQSLTSGDFQEWQFGLEFSVPIGFRKEMAGVRYAQLNLARERTVLREEELEVSHQLASAIRDLDLQTVLMRTNFNARIAAKKEVEAVQAAYDTGTVTLDVLLNAQTRLAETEIAYYRSVVSYALSIIEVHFRKGSLLEYNGVYLAEGPWPGKAYFDARRRARERDAGLYLDYGFTQPKVVSRGGYDQQPYEQLPVGVQQGVPAEAATPELVPTPEPEVNQSSGIELLPPVDGRSPASAWPHAIAPRRGQLASGSADTAAGLSNLMGQEPELLPLPRVEAQGQTGVKPVSYEAPAPAAGGGAAAVPARSGWKSVQKSSSPNEPVANPTPAPSARPASGWKGI